MIPRGIAVVTIALAAGAQADEPQRLAVQLFGETVGEAELSVERAGDETTLTYRSDLRVVRDHVRLRQQAFIESRFDSHSGRLLRSRARRCTGPAEQDEPGACTEWRVLEASEEGAVPGLAAELMLARRDSSKEPVCLETIDEESGERGRICARLRPSADGGVELDGTKLGTPFRARVRGDRLLAFEAPEQGIRFAAVRGRVQVSESDLFANPVALQGDVAPALRSGRLRVRLHGMSSALEVLRDASGPGQAVTFEPTGAAVLQTRQLAVPKDREARALLDKVAFAVMQARGSHEDCQTATDWFLGVARERGWKARRALGVAWVDGRFAFHAWAVVDTGAGEIPVDPLLAQAPADAGHLQLVPDGSPGEALMRLRNALLIEVVEPKPSR